MSTDAPPPPSRWAGAFFALVGVLMFLGFGGALAWRAWESMSAPQGPTHVASTSLLASAQSGASWVAIDAAFEPCAYPTIPSNASTASYRVLAGATGTPIGLAELSGARACTDTPHEMRGLTNIRALADLELPPDATTFLQQSLGDTVVVLWVDASPRLELGEAAMFGAMGALGLCIAWFYAAAFFARSAKVRLAPRADRPAPPLLPPRPLRLAAAYRASPMIAIVFFAVCTVMFGGMTFSQLPPSGWPDGETMLLMGFGGAMTLVFVLFLLVMLRNAFRARPTVQAPREAWAPVLAHDVALAKGVDVGNRALAYRDPFTLDGEPERVVQIIVGANEGMPWIVDGQVLVARSEGDAAHYVLRIDGGPFELSDAETAKIAG